MVEVRTEFMKDNAGHCHDDPLDILIVSQYYWPEDFRINDLANGLVARGHQVTVLTGLPNYPSGTFQKGYGMRGPWTQYHANVKIIRAPMFPRGNKSKFSLVANYASIALCASIVALFRCRRRFDAIFVYHVSPVTVGFPAIIAKKSSGAPLFFWALDLWPESLSASGMIKSEFANSVARLMARIVYAHSDVILAPSRSYFDSIRNTAQQDRDIRYFPQWAGEASAEQQKTGVAASLMPRGFKVMFTGNIGASQDFETILAAAELLKDCGDISWVIVGDGHRLAWLRAEVERRGLSQTFHCLGRFSSASMPEFFVEADVLLATLKDEPVFALTVPAKIQSYLAAGRPIITAINGEVVRIMSEAKAGVAVPAGDAIALSVAVRQLADTPLSEREAMGERGRAYFHDSYDRDKLFDQLVGWFKAVSRTGMKSSKRDATVAH